MWEQIVSALGSCGNKMFGYQAHAGTNSKRTGTFKRTKHVGEQIVDALGSFDSKFYAQYTHWGTKYQCTVLIRQQIIRALASQLTTCGFMREL